MSGGIESMHEDEPRQCRGCGKARDLEALLMYFRAAQKEPDQERKLTMALELCHSLIVELQNHVYCLHGK